MSSEDSKPDKEADKDEGKKSPSQFLNPAQVRCETTKIGGTCSYVALLVPSYVHVYKFRQIMQLKMSLRRSMESERLPLELLKERSLQQYVYLP